MPITNITYNACYTVEMGVSAGDLTHIALENNHTAYKHICLQGIDCVCVKNYPPEIMQPSSSMRATIVSAENQNGATIVKATFFFCHYYIVWKPNTVKCHYNACHYNANASLTRSILGSQTAPTCPHNHPQVAQHMGKRCEIIAVWSATAAMTPLCSHTNGIKQRYPTCWLCQYSRFMIDLRSNTQIIHLRCSENAIIWPIWLLDARMLKTIPVAIKLR